MGSGGGSRGGAAHLEHNISSGISGGGGSTDGVTVVGSGKSAHSGNAAPAVTAAANLIVILSSGVWECEEVISALRQVKAASSQPAGATFSSPSSVASTLTAPFLTEPPYTYSNCHICNGSSDSSSSNGHCSCSSGSCNVMLLYVDVADNLGGCHVPTPRSAISPSREFLSIADGVCVDLERTIESAPDDLKEMLSKVRQHDGTTES